MGQSYVSIILPQHLKFLTLRARTFSGLVAVFIYYNHEVEDEIKGFFEMMEPKWGKWCGPIMATLAITGKRSRH